MTQCRDTTSFLSAGPTLQRGINLRQGGSFKPSEDSKVPPAVLEPGISHAEPRSQSEFRRHAAPPSSPISGTPRPPRLCVSPPRNPPFVRPVVPRGLPKYKGPGSSSVASPTQTLNSLGYKIESLSDEFPQGHHRGGRSSRGSAHPLCTDRWFCDGDARISTGDRRFGVHPPARGTWRRRTGFLCASATNAPSVPRMCPTTWQPMAIGDASISFMHFAVPAWGCWIGPTC